MFLSGFHGEKRKRKEDEKIVQAAWLIDSYSFLLLFGFNIVKTLFSGLG